MDEPNKSEASSSGSSDVDFFICSRCKHLMEQPVLLACLHSCCERCSKQWRVGDAVRCETCCAETPISKVIRNDLLFDQIRAHHASRGEAKCDFCEESEGVHRTAEAHCAQCNKFLCEQCVVHHRKFHPTHSAKYLSSMTSSEEKFITGPCRCKDHPDAICNFFCWSCEQLRCELCTVKCQGQGHNTKSIESSLPVMKEELCTAHKQLASRLKALDAIRSLGGKANKSRSALTNILLRNKRQLLEEIDLVFSEAKERLNTLCDKNFESELKSVSLALDLQQKSEDALHYSSVLENRDDVRHLVQQRHLVLDHLQLLDRNVMSLIADTKLPTVKISSTESPNLRDVIGNWIGTPELYPAEETQSVFCKFSHVEQSAWSSDELLCGRDISLTADGNVFIAMGHAGLKEFDDKSRELSSWRPPGRQYLAAEEVRSVEVLHGDLVAVGLKLLGCITILRRSPEDRKKWHEDRRITGNLRGAPYSMSASADLLVIAEGRRDDMRTPKPGREIVVVYLSSGAVASRRTWDYEISCVAVSPEFICTASESKVPSASTDQTVSLATFAAATSFVVDGYRHENGKVDTWTFIWRYEHDCKVGDMCLYSEKLTTGLLFVTRLLLVSECGRVFIVASDRGIKQSVLFESETGNHNAVRLSALNQPSPKLALLFRNGKVRVYSP